MAWLTAMTGGPTPPIEGSAITVLAICVALVGVALRLPILETPRLSQVRRDAECSDHVVLLLCYAASLNWVAYLVLRGGAFVDSLPALMIVAGSEIWIHQRFRASECLAWSKLYLNHLSRPFSRLTMSEQGTTKSDSPKHLHNDSTGATPNAATANWDGTSSEGDKRQQLGQVEEIGESDLDREAGVVRRTVESLDESGRRSISGEVQVRFDAGETFQEVVIGFMPPFSNAPDTEFEVDAEGTDVRLINSTPLGMRLGLRIRPPADSELSNEGAETLIGLHWYASERAENLEPSQDQAFSNLETTTDAQRSLP